MSDEIFMNLIGRPNKFCSVAFIRKFAKILLNDILRLYPNKTNTNTYTSISKKTKKILAESYQFVWTSDQILFILNSY